jgi:sugar phosphate isomerase/epimerase
MMSRRTILLGAPVAGLAAKSGASVQVGCQTNAWPIDPSDPNSLLHVLGVIKQIGFEGFETGFRNLQSQFAEPAAARKNLQKSGLRFFGIHIFLLSYDTQTSIAQWDLLKQVADGGAALGAQRLIVSGASTPDAAALSRKAEALNRIGKYCREKGIGFGYHNHHVEFQQNGFQIQGLLRETDPDAVHLVVDAGHAVEGGANIAEFFAAYSRRIDGMHLRDSRAGQEIPLGQGDYDWRPLAAAIRAANWNGWLLAEEERLSGEKPGETATRPARETIRRIFGV